MIPVELRRELGFEAGDDLLVWTEGRRLVMERRSSVLTGLAGMFSASDGVVDRLIAERREDAARDDSGPADGAVGS